ncbi:Mediator of RNA polymerase II transcription subunit 6 [Lecanora helva]
MGSSQQPPLDEIQWNHPNMVQSIGGITTNTGKQTYPQVDILLLTLKVVLPYFAESPFYDQTSNNAVLTVQAFSNPNMYHFLQTREAFEGRLRTMQGLEFMVTHDPSEKGTKVEHSGVWVIGKQTRRKRQGMQDEVTPISSYYVVGINVYMAPSVGNIVGSRVLSAVTSLTKLLSKASSLPTFTPATGYNYLPTTSKNQGLQSAQNSKEGTPMPGVATPLPTTQETTSSKSTSFSGSKGDIDVQGVQMLVDSYGLSLRYGNEYMDENPIVGEPGSFRLAKSQDSNLTSSISTNKSSQQSFKGPTPASTPAPTKEVPPPLKTDNIDNDAKKPTKGAEKSPTTPGVGGKKDKKERRKSKVAGASRPATPKATTPKTTTPI